MNWSNEKSILKRNCKRLSIFLFTYLSAIVCFSQDTINYQGVPLSEYWKQSEVPLLGQLVPVNQINLQKGVHLFDIETIGKQWQGLTNPFDTMGLGSFDTQNQEAIIRLRYAYPLARYTYIGVTAGFASRSEAELYHESGMIDPEIFIGQHIPWRNGNFRLSLTASPSIGPSEVKRSISIDSDSATGNFNRGGWSIRPEASVTARVNKFLFGAEVNYLYMGERTINEDITVTQEALLDPDIQTSLTHQYFGYNQSQFGFGSNGLAGSSGFENGQTIQTTVTGGNAWAIKGLLEIPDWYRVGGEIIYGQIDSSLRKNDFGKEVQNEGGDFQEVRLYGRYKFSDNMSLTPLISWMPSLPLTRGQQRIESTQDVWGFQLTFRSKFEL